MNGQEVSPCIPACCSICGYKESEIQALECGCSFHTVSSLFASLCWGLLALELVPSSEKELPPGNMAINASNVGCYEVLLTSYIVNSSRAIATASSSPSFHRLPWSP